MCTYLKNMGGYKAQFSEERCYEEIQKLFDKAYKQVSLFVPMDSEEIDEHVEAEKDDDQEEEEMKKHIKIVKDDEVAIDAIHLAIKPIVMFKPDIKSEVWRNLQGYKVTIWKLFDTCGVHFVRFKNLHIFMLVEKRYPLTPITITNMLNKKLQADHWNEIFYQLLKLMTKEEKGQ
ncbi:hypothetical protein Tco_0332190 [Tanacetum coccineum]